MSAKTGQRLLRRKVDLTALSVVLSKGVKVKWINKVKTKLTIASGETAEVGDATKR